ncbi:hypothetical protein V2J09_006371 [Rumex salicifolius]
MAVVTLRANFLSALFVGESGGRRQRFHGSSPRLRLPSSNLLLKHHQQMRFQLLHYPAVLCCSAAGNPSSPPTSSAYTRLYISGLSFRTTEESLRIAFEQFGKLTEANLVMDKIANRPRGFAFLRYATKDEARKAIDGMHGKVYSSSIF